MTERQTCDVVDIEFEEPISELGSGTWVVTVDVDGDETEYKFNENPRRSKAQQELVDKIEDVADSDDELVAEVEVIDSPAKSGTDTQMHDIQVVETEDNEIVTDGGSDVSQTTDDLEDVDDARVASTSGGYTVSGEAIVGTVYEAALANDGRVPTDPHIHVQAEGYAREIVAKVYAPAPNPYHVAADIVDGVHEEYGGEQVTVDIYVEDTGAELEQQLRATRLGYNVEQGDEEALDATLAVIRNHDQTDRDANLHDELREADDVPDYVVENLEELFAVGDDPLENTDSRTEEKAKSRIRRAADRPADAWQHHLIEASIHQEASNPDYV